MRIPVTAIIKAVKIFSNPELDFFLLKKRKEVKAFENVIQFI